MSAVGDVLRLEIARAGAISFARFMALALYHPDAGYYERDEPVTGRSGDFYTSVSVGPLFGELLAERFARWLSGLPEGPVQVVEAGAHDGRLAADLLAHWEARWPQLFDRLEYILIEPSRRRCGWQARRLGRFGQRIRWFPDLAALSPAGIRGVVFGNELLDALPVHRLEWDASQRRWFERGVGYDGQRFRWIRLDSTTSPVGWVEPNVPEGLADVLPDGYCLEACPEADRWWAHAAQTLQRGWLVAIDYGLTGAERFAPERARGTLRAYRRHQLVDDLLADPGEQDLTAHVDFERVMAIGEVAGLTTEGLWPQGVWLTRVVAELDEGATSGWAWTAVRRRQLLTLTHPQHLGRAFRVLVQHRSP